jgi:hypothetical protein
MKTSQRIAAEQTAGRDRFALGTFATLLGTLFIQFLLGMYNNLYVDLADPRHGTGPLTAHIVLGLLLVLGGVVAVIAGLRARRVPLIAVALLGLIATALAVVSGFNFLRMGNDVYSYTMAVGFICTVAFDVVGLVLAASYRRDA